MSLKNDLLLVGQWGGRNHFIHFWLHFMVSLH